MRVGLLGNGQPLFLLIESLLKENILIVFVHQDKKLGDADQTFFENKLNDYNVFLQDNISVNNVDLILSFNFNKIIDTTLLKNTKLLNIHIGLLPKWRGNSANSWAVLNGEKKVGYTIHFINNVLDGGDIIYKFSYPVDYNSNYKVAKDFMMKDLDSNINKILLSVYENKDLPTYSATGKFVYCTKIRKSDGIIKDWNIPSIRFVQLNYLFKNGESGITFNHKGSVFTIGELSVVKEFKNSVGITGSIVNIVNNSIWLKTFDTAIELRDIKMNNEKIQVDKYFKIGNRL